MHVDTAEFRAIKAEALEVKALRRGLVVMELVISELEREAEQRGYEHGQPFRLIAGGRS